MVGGAPIAISGLASAVWSRSSVDGLSAMHKKGAKAQRGKLQRRSEKPPPMANQQLGRQIRKILGKHYANKYRVR
jgi:hypothetical protein